jgi:alpha-tubulin suppressor-like RCC1 family protein
VWCWGRNSAVGSQEGAPLGIPGAAQLDVPTQVGTGADWLELSTDTFHTCAVNRASELYCWGRDIEGQLGLGSEFEPTPVLVPGSFARVSVGRFFTCAVTADGLVACAGENDQGQLGQGDRQRRAVFTSAE